MLCLVLIPWFSIIIPKPIDTNLHISNMDRPGIIGLFIFTFVLFVLIANRFSENHVVVLCDNLVSTLNSFFFCL